eukprot:scaffold504181_cov34-Prasinocladus_malaysianus.AAC.2
MCGWLGGVWAVPGGHPVLRPRQRQPAGAAPRRDMRGGRADPHQDPGAPAAPEARPRGPAAGGAAAGLL